MKMFIWINPYSVADGSSTYRAVAENLEQARRLAATAPAFDRDYEELSVDGDQPDRSSILDKEPTEIIDLPYGEWNLLSEEL